MSENVDFAKVRGDRLAELIGHFNLPIRYVGVVTIPELETAVQTELLAFIAHAARVK